MRNRIRCIAKEWKKGLLAFFFLMLQVGCMLAIPYLTAEMIDTGIGQGGIVSPLAGQISASGMEKLMLLMNQEEREITNLGYREDGPVYTRNEMSPDEEERLLAVMTPPMVAVYALSTDGADYEEVLGEDLYVPRGLDAFGILKLLPEEARLDLTEAARERIKAISPSLIRQAAMNFIREDMKEQGIDVQGIQNGYLVKRGVLLILSAIGSIGFAAASAYFASGMSSDCAAHLRGKLFCRVFSMDEEDAASFSVEELMERTAEDTEKVRHFVQMLLQNGARFILLGIGAAVLARSMGEQLGIIVFLTFFLAFLFLVVLACAGFRPSVQKRLQERAVWQIVRENLTGMMVIRAFGQEKREEERFRSKQEGWRRASLQMGRIFLFLIPTLLLIMNAALLWLAKSSVSGINEGWLQSGGLVAGIQYIILIIGGCLSIAADALLLPEGAAAYKRAASFLKQPVKDEICRKTGRSAPKAEQLLCFEHVTCRYPGNRREVLQDITFTVQAGEKVAVVGGTGAGKTALLLLALGAMKVSRGHILADGKDIEAYGRKELSRLVSCIPQNPKLFSGSIAENLRFRKADASEEELMEAVRAAQAETFISQTENGLETAVSQGGTNFSGGQRQRLAAARALVGGARIYLFDDCYSALDEKTAVLLKEALSEKTKDAAVLITSSRLELIRDADRILVLDGGRIIGMGDHKELLKTCSVYRDLVLSQSDAGWKAGEVTEDALQI